MKQIFTKLFGIILWISPLSITAQQLGFYALHQDNWQAFNPAAPNTVFLKPKNQSFNALNFGYRQQWLGVKGAPVNYNIHFETMFYSPVRKGLAPKMGGGLYGESAGPLINNTLYFNYAYPLTFGKKRSFKGAQHKLFIGFNAGYLHQRIDFNNKNLYFKDGFDDVVQGFLGEQKLLKGQGFFELTPGLFYTNTANFYVGLSSPRLVNAGKSNGALKILNVKPQVHLIAGGFNESRTLQPSLWVRVQPSIEYLTVVQNSPISATLNLKSQLNKSILVGAGISTGQWLHLEAGWTLGSQKATSMSNEQTMTLQFAYDLPISKTGFNLGQTAEVNFVVSF